VQLVLYEELSSSWQLWQESCLWCMLACMHAACGAFASFGLMAPCHGHSVAGNLDAVTAYKLLEMLEAVGCAHAEHLRSIATKASAVPFYELGLATSAQQHLCYPAPPLGGCSHQGHVSKQGI